MTELIPECGISRTQIKLLSIKQVGTIGYGVYLMAVNSGMH